MTEIITNFDVVVDGSEEAEWVLTVGTDGKWRGEPIAPPRYPLPSIPIRIYTGNSSYTLGKGDWGRYVRFTGATPSLLLPEAGPGTENFMWPIGSQVWVQNATSTSLTITGVNSNVETRSRLGNNVPLVSTGGLNAFVHVILIAPNTWSISEAIGPPGPQGDPGDVGPEAWATVVPWASSTAYTATAPRSTVTYNGETYVCNVSHTSTGTFAPENWIKIAAKGSTGDQGDQGPGLLILGTISAGAWSAPDPSPEVGDLYIAQGTITGGPPTAVAGDGITWNGTAWINVGQIRGPQGEAGEPGENGDPGPAATISVGTVTTGSPGSSVSITNSGTSSAVILDFTIPRGNQGDQGIQGLKGDQGDPGDPGVGVPPGGTTGQALVKSSNADYDTEWADVEGGGGSLESLTLTTSTGSLANGAIETLTCNLGKQWALTRIVADRPAWVILYGDSASAAADTRTAENTGTPPDPGKGYHAEFLFTSGQLDITTAPVVFGQNPTNSGRIRVRNTSGSTAVVALTLYYIRMVA